jgi:hypothetical protein
MGGDAAVFSSRGGRAPCSSSIVRFNTKTAERSDVLHVSPLASVLPDAATVVGTTALRHNYWSFERPHGGAE